MVTLMIWHQGLITMLCYYYAPHLYACKTVYECGLCLDIALSKHSAIASSGDRVQKTYEQSGSSNYNGSGESWLREDRRRPNMKSVRMAAGVMCRVITDREGKSISWIVCGPGIL